MPDIATLSLATAENSLLAGRSLAKTLYNRSVDILLSGELGAGKTTFLQGFAAGLGISEPISSPTYALEQRYATATHGEFIHIDLYRLSETEAKKILMQSDDHPGIRAIEWPERVSDDAWSRPLINIHIGEDGRGRRLTCSFEDMPLPTEAEVTQWRNDVLLPAHIQVHCNTVASFAHGLAKRFLARGELVRPLALRRASELHDLFRFVDFRASAHPPGLEPSPEQEKLWSDLRALYADKKHEEVCAEFLRLQNFPELADIVEPHGLMIPSPDRSRIEQKLLYYADKRIAFDQVVTLRERFDDLAIRYHKGASTPEAKKWLEETQEMEEELFPEGIR